MSQEKLADRLGLTFQQVQKYEKGANRISASRLAQIARIFEVAPSFFFEGAPSVAGPENKSANSFDYDVIAQFIGSAEGRALAKAFGQIDDATTRRAVVHMVEALADHVSRTAG